MDKRTLHSFSSLTTEHLMLRALEPEDRSAIFRLRNDENVSRFLDRNKQSTEREAEEFISKIKHSVDEGLSLYWAICLITNSELIGTICIWNISADGKSGEIGFELFPSYEGRGLMSEAVKAVLDYGFEKYGLTKIEACSHKDNHRSKKLLAKFGFHDLPGERNADHENNEMHYVLTDLKEYRLH